MKTEFEEWDTGVGVGGGGGYPIQQYRKKHWWQTPKYHVEN